MTDVVGSSLTNHPLDDSEHHPSSNQQDDAVDTSQHNQQQDEEYYEDEEEALNRTGGGTSEHTNNQFGSQYRLGDGRPSFTGSTGVGGNNSEMTASGGTGAGVSDLGHRKASQATLEGANQSQRDVDDEYHLHGYDFDEKLPCNVRAPPPLPRDPVEGAYQQFPVVFLQYSAEKDIRVVPVGSPDPFLPAKLASQRHSLSETPVVTGSTDTVLDALLPPRRTTVTFYNQNEGLRDTVDVVQRVSHAQIKREELRHLRVELDARLKQSNARHDGICNVRRGIHALMFDELVRQVTIDCPERGILLRRVRDEIQMTLDAYHTLYDESVAYSTNRCVAAAKYTPAMTQAIDGLNRDISELRKELRKLQAKESAMLRCVDEQESSDHKKYEEERTFLERTQQRLQSQLEAVKEAQEAQKRALREAAF